MGFRTWWRNRQRSKHMLDGPGMINIPNPFSNGKKRLCSSCGRCIEPHDEHLELCPQCGAKLPEADKE